MLVKLFEAIRNSAIPTTLAVGSRVYSTTELNPIRIPKPTPLEVSNLSSLVTYVRDLFESDSGLTPAGCFVHVQSPVSVAVLTAIEGEFKDRNVYLKATESFSWKNSGVWMNPDQFIVMLLSQFEQDYICSSVMKLVGNIEDANVMNFSDDGVTQTVTARTGVVKRENVPVQSRVTLTPYRSFSEATQAPSPFVLRMQSGKGDNAVPTVALFEADGGVWRNQAMANVKKYLTEALPEGVVVLA